MVMKTIFNYDMGVTWFDRLFRRAPPPMLSVAQHRFYSPVDDLLSAMSGMNGKISRADALTVPAMVRGRNLVCSIATLPLQVTDTSNDVLPSSFLAQPDPDVPKVVHYAQTLEDLLLYAVAWWQITGFAWDGYPATARRLDPCTVSVTPPYGRSPAPLPSGIDPRTGVVYVDGRPISGSEIIRFDSPNPGVLVSGVRAIKRALLLDRAAKMYAETPAPADIFTPTDGADPVDDEEIAAILAEWQAARRQRSTAYIPAALKHEVASQVTPAELQLVELQKQATIEIANLLGIDPEELGVSTTSRTYSNVNDRRIDKINETLAPYMSAITDRLSMADVTKRGQTVRFDLSGYLKANASERWANYEKAVNMGAISVEEVRATEGLPPGAPTPEPIAEPEPMPVDASAEPAYTFSRPATFVDLPLEKFTVDAQTRTIEGVAVPYGRTAKGVRFERGALKFADVSRVKLLRDHDPAQLIGVATSIKDSTNGLAVKFRVARNVAGDEALALAEDGILDGLSVGVDFDASKDTVADPRHKGGVLVQRADLREVSLTGQPAFDDARVTRVAASLTKEEPVPDTDTTTAPEPTPEPTPAVVPAQQFTAEQAAQLVQALPALQAFAAAGVDQKEVRAIVNPVRPVATAVVREALPYRFQRPGVFAAFQQGDHVFSADLHAMARLGDDGSEGGRSDAGKRVMGLMRRTFVITTDIDELNPAIQRPDLFVDQRDFRYPIYSSIDRGAPPNGVQPFTFPKFSSSSGLTADHVEGTEPTAGTYVTTSQTVTPTPVSGKVRITREVWDMGGNPAVSSLIFNQMVRGYREGLESAAATFLNTLTAATDINLGVAATDAAFTAAWEAAVAGLQFVRGYDFSTFVVDQTTYLKAVGARTTDGRAYYPQITPTNANGQSEPRFAQLNMAGVLALPSWALPSTPGSPNNSWLYDPAVVWGFSTPPQRLEFPGSGAANIYSPVAFVDLAIWGYKAFANTDIAGVRQVIYDSV